MFDLNYISELLQALLLAILPILAAAGVNWLLKEAALQKAKLTTEQQTFISNLIKVAVLAAEQFGLNAKVQGIYLDKKKWAVEFITRQITAAGLTVDTQYIWDAIEGAVLDEFNRWQDLIDNPVDGPTELAG